MIKIENVETAGWKPAIRGMRNPLNSWDKSDSEVFEIDYKGIGVDIGEKDLELMKKLSTAGTDHSKYLRMITVYCDITAPLYWWKEFDTYKVGTVANSCSTMHKIHDKEFTLGDFSHEHLAEDEISRPNGVWLPPIKILSNTIDTLNMFRELYIHTKDKKWWWQIIQLLPSSYNQKRTVMLNYQVLQNMYSSRKNHKLDEWQNFCKWVENLPYSELITG